MNYLTLTRKGEAEPVDFAKLDEEVCAHLGVPVHPEYWAFDWFNAIAQGLLEGRTFAQVRTDVRTARIVGRDEEELRLVELYRDRVLTVCDYLEEHFVVNDPTFLKGAV